MSRHNKIRIFTIIIILLFIGNSLYSNSDKIHIGLVKYKGGDWYSAKKGIINFIDKFKNKFNYPIDNNVDDVTFDSHEIFNYPILILNGHGQILFDDKEKNNMMKYLDNGGTLIVNDDYGLDKSFRELIEEIYPNNELLKLNNDHDIFNCYYEFSEGLPKIHEHDGKPASLWALYLNKRIVIFYIYSSDILDGWEKPEVHNNPEKLIEKAFRFGVNLIYYILTN